MRPLYRAVLRDAATVTVRDRYLWPFALFAAVLLTGSAYDLILRSWDNIVGSRLGGGTGFALTDALAAVAVRVGGPATLADLPWWLLPIALAVLAVAAFVFWFAAASQGTLLAAIAAEEERKRPNLATFFAEGKKAVLPLLGINVLVRLLVALAVLAVAAVLIPAAAAEDPFLAAGTILSFVILIPTAYLLVTLAFFAALGVVRFREPFPTAIGNAWSLVAHNWLVVVETSFLVLAADLAISVAIAVGAFVITVPFLVLFLMARVFNSLSGFWLILALYLVTLTVTIVAAAGAAVTFHYAVWTLLAERLRKGHQPVAKVLRLARTAGGFLHSRR